MFFPFFFLFVVAFLVISLTYTPSVTLKELMNFTYLDLFST